MGSSLVLQGLWGAIEKRYPEGMREFKMTNLQDRSYMRFL